MLPTHGRYSYAPINERPFFRWPNGAGLAVYLALNVEHYAFSEGLAEDLVPGMEQPDVLNSSWREYGTRIGAWRLLDLFKEFDMPATILLNSAVCDHAPQLVRAMVDDGHEIAAHGRTNSESQAGLSENNERALIDLVTDGIARAAGSRPTGWLSPWLAETKLTPDLLQEAGYTYLLDWCADDQPIWLTTRGGRILSLPYAQEINDSAAIMGRFVGAAEFADIIIDQVDEMLAQSAKQPLVLGIALHANIIGQPFRIRHLRRALTHLNSLSERVWLTRAADIVAAVKAQPEQVV
ncbi:MAG: polysaccharide deacetylase family protein [Alphaproteobacteria bacterium]|nr:polysaccharide deacetylase family protein [Alphaproteobacteria bacterium]